MYYTYISLLQPRGARRVARGRGGVKDNQQNTQRCVMHSWGLM